MTWVSLVTFGYDLSVKAFWGYDLQKCHRSFFCPPQLLYLWAKVILTSQKYGSDLRKHVKIVLPSEIMARRDSAFRKFHFQTFSAFHIFYKSGWRACDSSPSFYSSCKRVMLISRRFDKIIFIPFRVCPFSGECLIETKLYVGFPNCEQ